MRKQKTEALQASHAVWSIAYGQIAWFVDKDDADDFLTLLEPQYRDNYEVIEVYK